MRKKGFVKSPHGKLYKEYSGEYEDNSGDLTIILSFNGKNETLNNLIFVYCHPEDCIRKFNLHIRKGVIISEYSGGNHSVLCNLKRFSKEMKKTVKQDLMPLWTQQPESVNAS